MPRRQEGSQPTWTDVKARLVSFDQLGLLGLIQDLYVAHKDNQTFLHARFGLGQDILKPYKETLDRWNAQCASGKPDEFGRPAITVALSAATVMSAFLCNAPRRAIFSSPIRL